MLFLGADTVILARLAPGNDQIKTDTQEHLDVSLYRSIIYLKLYKGRSYPCVPPSCYLGYSFFNFYNSEVCHRWSKNATLRH